MGGGPKTTQQSTGTTTNTYGWTPPPDWADLEGLRGFKFQSDPRIGHAFARGRGQAHESFNSPTGGYTTPQLRDATLRASDEDSTQQEAQAYREEDYGRQALEYGKLADIAQMTAPRLTQTGGSSTQSGTSQTNPSVMDSIMKGGSLALMAF